MGEEYKYQGVRNMDLQSSSVRQSPLMHLGIFILLVLIRVQAPSYYNYKLFPRSQGSKWGRQGGGKGEEGMEKKKKKSEIPAISPRATRGTFVPFFILH